MAERVLVRARRVLTLDGAGTTGEWLLLEGERIAAVGSGDPPGAQSVAQVDGVVIPGFVDAHVHLTHTGLLSAGVDLRSCRSIPDALGAIKEFMKDSRTEWILAGNFDPAQTLERRMPDRRDLDTIAQFRAVWLSRIDGHCCSLTGAGMARLDLDPTLPGVELDARGKPNGILVGRANEEARRGVLGALADHQLRLAQLTACRAALEHGITAVHEMAGSVPGGRDMEVLRSSGEPLPIAVRVYLATLEVARAREAGLDCVGGDLLLDGSLGSSTAALGEPYEDGSGTGILYHEDEKITRFFVDATEARLQAGVHAIGDAAVEQAIRCLEGAAAELGSGGEAAMRALRHRIEHATGISPEQIPRVARLGIVASVQPAFDRAWGGPGGMYESRLGSRAASMNPLRTMLDAGITLAGGSDSPVTPLDPLAGVAAAAAHHVEEFRTSIDQALRMFTMGGALAGREEADRGSLEAGKRADFCVLSDDPSGIEPDDVAALEVLETWVGGRRAWSAEAGFEASRNGLEWQRGSDLPQMLF